MSQEAQSKELVSISALRGLAALGVVFFHVRADLWIGWRALRAGVGEPSFWDRLVAWFSIPTPFLGSGVMLFFLISGFCIALPYAGDTGRPLRFREYLARRLGRIYPPYLATLGLCLLVEWLTRNALPGSSAGAILATAAMVQNYTTGQVVSNPSFWSLPVEVELYLLFPLLHVLFQRWGVTWVLFVTGAVSAAALGGYLLGFLWLDANAAKYWLLWSAGAVLAEWYKRGRLDRPPMMVLVAGAIAAILTVAAELQGMRPAILHFGYGFVYFVLIWWALACEARWAALPAVLLRPLLLLGTISYSLYLVHYPLFRLGGHYWVQAFGQKPVNFLIPAGCALAAVGAGWVFYRLVEAPSHAWAKRLAAWVR